MTIKYHTELEQGSDEWFQVRLGLLTASEMHNIINLKTLEAVRPRNKNKECSHLYELLAQRVTKYVEPQYIGDDMLRGMESEIEARDLYSKHYAPVEEVGFITNDKWGFTIGYSPDGLVGDDGLIEVKGRRQKFQIEMIADNETPEDYLLQCQTGLLVSERKWIDFIGYHGGTPMFVNRVYPDDKIQNAIIEVAGEFEIRLTDKLNAYNERIKSLIPTERKTEQEII